jgi:putative PIN family toxin of toxin-antitoxin system
MKICSVVVDTNVLVCGLRSRRGASFKLLSLVGSGAFTMNLSVPLVFEYEEVLKKMTWPGKPATHYLDDIIDYICSVGQEWKIYYLWRPKLPDPRDEMVLELAVTSRSDYIITFNKKDFREAKEFGITVYDPIEFLSRLGGNT